ncbi:MAG: hypothetical protein ACD_19C00149G0001, partial [uncultured bacterium]
MNNQINVLESLVNDLLQKGNTHGLDRVLRLLGKELELYKNNDNGRVAWEQDKTKFSSNKIQIGSGGHYLEGF